jgi:hypothetical protein
MPNILHRLTIDAPPERVRSAPGAWSDFDYSQEFVGCRDAIVVVVLGDDAEPVLDRCRGDQSVCEFDQLMDARGFAICDESRPADHDGLADRDRVGCASERERVGPPRATCGIGGVENTELKLANRDNRYRYVVG